MFENEYNSIVKDAPQSHAVNNSFALLSQLNEQGPCDLVAIVKNLGTSELFASELLKRLMSLDLVRIRSDERFEALWTLRPREITILRASLRKIMPKLCQATECTIEWYETSPEGMYLEMQDCPTSEVRVQAKEGSIRKWGEELDAVIRLGYAFNRSAPRLKTTRIYSENGVIGSLPKNEAEKLIEETKTQKFSYDVYFTSKGVRRAAMAIFHPINKRFLGVLAIAERYHFTGNKEPGAFIALLEKEVHEFRG